MPFRIQSELTGVREVLARMNRVKDSARKRANKKGVTEGAKIVNKAEKQYAPIRFKVLRKSIGQRVKVYRGSGAAVGVIGPRWGFRQIVNGEPVNPIYYAHLVNNGFRFYGDLLRWRDKSGKLIFRRMTGRVLGRHFMQKALRSNTDRIQRAMRDAVWTTLAKEATK